MMKMKLLLLLCIQFHENMLGIALLSLCLNSTKKRINFCFMLVTEPLDVTNRYTASFFLKVLSPNGNNVCVASAHRIILRSATK